LEDFYLRFEMFVAGTAGSMKRRIKTDNFYIKKKNFNGFSSDFMSFRMACGLAVMDTNWKAKNIPHNMSLTVTVTESFQTKIL
jgi:hypothetical protein